MGTSTNATIAFGINLGEELPEAFADFDEEEGFDFWTWVEKQAGIKYPTGAASVDSANKEYKAYKKARDAALAACPVTVETHCSGEYPEYFLAINGTVTTARRGFPERLEIGSLVEPSVEQLDAFLSFCEKHKIVWEEPAWRIFSYWG